MNDHISLKEEYIKRGELEKFYSDNFKFLQVETKAEEKSELMKVPSSPLFKIITKGQNNKQLQQYLKEKLKMEANMKKMDINFTKG